MRCQAFAAFVARASLTGCRVYGELSRTDCHLRQSTCSKLRQAFPGGCAACQRPDQAGSAPSRSGQIQPDLGDLDKNTLEPLQSLRRTGCLATEPQARRTGNLYRDILKQNSRGFARSARVGLISLCGPSLGCISGLQTSPDLRSALIVIAAAASPPSGSAAHIVSLK